MMNKVALADIVGNAAYEKMRELSRQRIIELKRRRRVSGDQVTLCSKTETSHLSNQR
jgi:hypothetical protein